MFVGKKAGASAGWRRRLRPLPLFAALAPAALSITLDSAGAPSSPGRPGLAPSVILITLDTTRADHVGSRDGRPSLTPNLDGLAARGLRYA
jgi:hypothetical protein